MSQGTHGDDGTHGGGAPRPGGGWGAPPPSWQQGQPQPPDPQQSVPQRSGPQQSASQQPAPQESGPQWQVPGARAGAGPVDVRAQLTRLGIVNPLGGLLVAVIAYVAASIVAVVLAVSTYLAMVLSASSSSGTTSGPSSGGGTTDPAGGDGAFELLRGILGIPAQLVASGTFGSYRIDVQAGFLLSGGGSTRALPLAITATIVLLGWFGGRFLRRRQSGAKLLGMALTACVSGLLLAIVTTAIARILAFRIATDDVSVSMHAAGFDAFFGAWFLLGGALLLGQLSIAERPRWWSTAAEATAGPRLALVHLMAYSAAGILVLSVAVVVRGFVDGTPAQGLALILLLPVAIGQVVAYLAGFGVLGSVHYRVFGSVPLADSTVREDRWLWLFTQDANVPTFTDPPWYPGLPWFVGVLLLLVGLVLIAVIGALWGHGRRIAPRSVPALVISWITLPVAYGLGGIVLLILGAVSLDAGLAGLGSLSAGIHLGPWLPLLTGIVGLLVEVSSRVLGPATGRAGLGALLGWFRRRQVPVEGGVAPTLIPSALRGGVGGRGGGSGGGFGATQHQVPPQPWQQGTAAGSPWSPGQGIAPGTPVPPHETRTPGPAPAPGPEPGGGWRPVDQHGPGDGGSGHGGPSAGHRG